MIAIGLPRVWMREGDLQLVHRLQEHPLALILQILERSLLGDQIRMSDDRPDEEPIIRHFLPRRDLRLPQIQMHLLVGGGQRLQVVRPHPVQLQLEGAGGLEVSVDAILLEAVPLAVREELRELLVLERAEGDPADAAALELLLVAGAEAAEHAAHRRVVRVALVADGDVDDVDWLVN